MIAQSELASEGDYLLSLIRPAIDILRSDSPPSVATSKFGGTPSLPVGMEWPTHQLGPYRFLGQINFAEVPSVGGKLPAHGLLSLFVADDPDGEYFWGDDGYILAHYFSAKIDFLHFCY